MSFLLVSLCACLLAIGQARGGGMLDGRVEQLEAYARVVSQRYCAQEAGDELFVTKAELRITLTNVSPRRVIVSRRLAPHGAFHMDVATSMADAEQRRLEFSITNDLELYPPDTEVPDFGSSPPESEFIVLEPGQSFDAASSLGLLTRARGVASPAKTLEMGSEYAVRVTVSLWRHRMMTEPEVVTLRERWAAAGGLVAGMITTDYFPLDLTADGAVEVCSE